MFFDSQIREKLAQLQEKREKINNKWQDKMDHLQIGMPAKHIFHEGTFNLIVPWQMKCG